MTAVKIYPEGYPVTVRLNIDQRDILVDQLAFGPLYRRLRDYSLVLVPIYSRAEEDALVAAFEASMVLDRLFAVANKHGAGQEAIEQLARHMLEARHLRNALEAAFGRKINLPRSA